MSNQIDALASLEARLSAMLPAGAKTQLRDTPDFPLAFNVALPPCSRCANGHVGIRFTDLVVDGVDTIRVDRANSLMETETVSASLRWDVLRVHGCYALVGKPAPVIGMDTGGSLLASADIRPAGAATLTPLDPALKDAMLDRARQQRVHLMNDPNGVKLMGQYNEHNEVFNTVFITSAAARAAWAAEGATKEMAEHTHSALDPVHATATVVNPSGDQATFGAHKVTYNQNAFVQQLQMAVNTIAADPDFDPFSPTAEADPNSKYTKASLAALTFGSAVGQTGNTKSSIKPMTASQIHASVKAGAPPKSASVAELNNILKQGTQPGGAAAAVAASRDWRVLDEDDRRLVRHHLYAAVTERAERAIVKADVLWSGACSASVAGATARLEFTMGERPILLSVSVQLPAFEFEIDDAAWVGPTADIARERLSAVSFIRSLLRERIESGLSQQILEASGLRRRGA